MPRNWCLDISKSVRLCKFWCELLALSEGDLQWRFYTVNQRDQTELGTRYALKELCQIVPPFIGSRYNLETIVRSIDSYLSRGSFEERLGGWLRAPASPEDPQDPPGAGLSDVADILLGESQGEGIIPALLERNRQIKCLLGYQDEKQTLGERIVTAHEAFNLALNDPLTAHDRVIREEVSKASGEPSKKNYQILDIGQNSAEPPPPIRQVWTQKVWTLRLGSDLSPSKQDIPLAV